MYIVVEQGDTLNSTFAFSASQNDKPITLMLQKESHYTWMISKYWGYSDLQGIYQARPSLNFQKNGG